MMDLTDKMKDTLIEVGFGVRKYSNRYRSTDDPEKFIDSRSLQALYNRGLITWGGSGGALHQIHIVLTESGSVLFEELNELRRAKHDYP